MKCNREFIVRGLPERSIDPGFFINLQWWIFSEFLMAKSDNTPDMSVKIGGLALKNPVMTASGTFGYGEEFKPFVELNRLGALIVKGLSIKPEKR